MPADLAPDPNEQPDVPETFNLGDFTHQNDIQNYGEEDSEFVIDREIDGEIQCIKIPFEDLQELDITKFEELVKDFPFAVHYILRRAFTEARKIIITAHHYETAINTHDNQLSVLRTQLIDAHEKADEAEARVTHYKDKYSKFADKLKTLQKEHDAREKEMESARARAMTSEKHAMTLEKQLKARNDKNHRRSHDDSEPEPDSDSDSDSGSDTNEKPQNLDDYANLVHKDQRKPIETDRDVESPKKFDVDGSVFEEWFRGLENKLAVTTFRDTGTGLRGIHQHTTGEVWAYLEARVPTLLHRNDRDSYDTIQEMLEDLVAKYGDRNAYERAFSELEEMKQEQGQGFSEFYVKFRRNANLVRLDDVRDKVKPHELRMLKKKLNIRYSNRVLAARHIKNLNDLVTECYQLENDFTNFDKEHYKRADKDRANNGTTIVKRGRNRENNNANANAYTNTVATPPAVAIRQRTEPRTTKIPWEQRPRQFQNLGATTKASNDRCYESHLCQKCELTGHRRTDSSCPLYGYERRPWANDFRPTWSNRGTRPNASGAATMAEESENGEATV